MFISNIYQLPPVTFSINQAYHIVHMTHDFDNLAVTESVYERRAWQRHGLKYLKYLDSLCASWKDNVSPTQLIRASEDYDGTAP